MNYNFYFVKKIIIIFMSKILKNIYFKYIAAGICHVCDIYNEL